MQPNFKLEKIRELRWCQLCRHQRHRRLSLAPMTKKTLLSSILVNVMTDQSICSDLILCRRHVHRKFYQIQFFTQNIYKVHDDVIKWKHFPRYWPFVRGIHRSPVNSPHKGQWRGALMFFYLHLNKRLRKQSWGWWFETLSRPLWRHCKVWRNYHCAKETTSHCSNQRWPCSLTYEYIIESQWELIFAPVQECNSYWCSYQHQFSKHKPYFALYFSGGRQCWSCVCILDNHKYVMFMVMIMSCSCFPLFTTHSIIAALAESISINHRNGLNK